jgi:hypothetical protein
MVLVGFRKVMDFFPSIFSQNELFWLDNIMPESKKKDRKTKKKMSENGTVEEFQSLKNGEEKLAEV